MMAEPIIPDIRKVEGYRIAIMARSGHGKSYLARFMVERIIDTYKLPAIIIEPVTEYESLLEIYPGVLFKDEEAIPLEPVTMFEVSLEVPITIINYENSPMSRTREIISKYFELLIRKAKKKKTPFLLVVEEAHLLAPQRFTRNTMKLLEQMEYVAKVGRKLGINYILITQRPASINKDVLSQINMLFMGAFSYPRDVKASLSIAETLGIIINEEELSSLEKGVFIEVVKGERLVVKAPYTKSKHLGGTPLKIKPITSSSIKYDQLVKIAKERLAKEKKYMTILIEEYNKLLNEIKTLKKQVRELEKQRDELKLKLETIQLVAEKLLAGKAYADPNKTRAMIHSLPKLEQCIYTQLSNEPTGKLPLSELASKCRTTRKSSRFLKALRRLRDLGLIDYSARRGRAWLKGANT